MTILLLALLLSVPTTVTAATNSFNAAAAHGNNQTSLDLSFQGYPRAKRAPHSLIPAQRSLHASRSRALKKAQPCQVLPNRAPTVNPSGQALPGHPHHILERDLLPYKVERASGLFSESNGLRGFMAHNWLNQTLGLQGGMAFRRQEYRKEDSSLRDNMAVGMGLLLAF